MRATANASSKQLPLVTRHSYGACGFIRRMIRAFIYDQCNTLSSSVILQRCISCSLYVASNQMPDKVMSFHGGMVEGSVFCDDPASLGNRFSTAGTLNTNSLFPRNAGNRLRSDAALYSTKRSPQILE